MFEMPALETTRLYIREFELIDLDAAYRLYDLELNADDLRTEKMHNRHERLEWLRWTVLNYHQLAMLNQPPYGDRAIVLKSNITLIGACGFVPCLNAFEQMPNFDYYQRSADPGLNTAEFGLFYAIFPSHRRQGYATEAARALVDYAFQQLQLKRVVATTDFNNRASMAVMQRLGMTIERNPHAEPPWLQVVGVLENK